jgi:1,4-dihydroxy-6-naphthoate synthase
VLLPHGGSFGSGYGPVLVASRALSRDELRQTEIVVPGVGTTAFLVLRLFLGADFPYRVMAFDEILPEVEAGRADAGLLIHEGQLTYEEHGLRKIVDLGEWWLLDTGLPLPLGLNVIRRDLGEGNVRRVSEILRESIETGLETRDDALDYALRFGRGLDHRLADRFVGMYVNELTQDVGDEGRKAVTELLRRGEAIGAFPCPVRIDFAA